MPINSAINPNVYNLLIRKINSTKTTNIRNLNNTKLFIMLTLVMLNRISRF